MVQFIELLKRIDRMSSRAAGSRDDAPMPSEIEDLLAEGYVQALTGEARSRRLGERLERLVHAIDEPGAAVEIRRLALQQCTLDRSVEDLRVRLFGMREHFIRLSGGRTEPD